MNTFSNSTAGLKSNLENSDNKIIVTTIQKLNNLMKSEDSLPVYQKPVIFIFDECHRSQFGEAQKNLKKNSNNSANLVLRARPFFPITPWERKRHWVSLAANCIPM